MVTLGYRTHGWYNIQSNLTPNHAYMQGDMISKYYINRSFLIVTVCGYTPS